METLKSYNPANGNLVGEVPITLPDDIPAIVDRARVDGAEIRTATSEGIDLQGTVVYRGVSMRDDGVALENQWYSGYFRVATTERAVVRSYLSTADRAYAEELEGGVRELLGNQLGGVVVD